VKTLLHGALTARSLQSLDVSRCAKITGAAFSDLHVKVTSAGASVYRTDGAHGSAEALRLGCAQ